MPGRVRTGKSDGPAPRQLTGLRCALALVVLLAALVVSVGAAPPAAAITASGTFPDEWPWRLSPSTTETSTYTGALCTIRVWSSTGGVDDASSWEWDNDTDGWIGYWCEYVGRAGERVLAGQLAADGNSWTGTTINFGLDLVSPNTALGGVDVPMLADGPSTDCSPIWCPTEQSGGVGQAISSDFRGTGGQWWRFQGMVKFKASCQMGGSGSMALCGTKPTGSQDLPYTTPMHLCHSGNTSNLSWPEQAWVVPTSSAGQSRILPRTGATGVPFACRIEAGVGVPTTGPLTPTGEVVEPGTGTCHVDAVSFHRVVDDPPPPSEPYETSEGAFVVLEAGEAIIAIATISWTGGGMPGAKVNLYAAQNLTRSTYALTLTESGAQRSISIPAPIEGFYNGSVTCTMNGRGQDEFFYVHPDDENAEEGEYHGPPGGLPPRVEDVFNDPDDERPEIGDFSRVLDCWDDVFETVSLLGVDFPWMWPQRVPEAVLCSLVALFVPTASDFVSLMGDVQDTLDSGPLGAVADYVSAPFDAMVAFSDGMGSGSCGGPSFTFPPTATVIQPLNACSEPMATVSDITRTGSLVMIYLGAILFAARVIAGAFGLSSGGDEGGDN